MSTFHNGSDFRLKDCGVRILRVSVLPHLCNSRTCATFCLRAISKLFKIHWRKRFPSLNARNVEYKDPIQEEWERFQKEIKEQTTVSTQIIEGDTEEATTERQIHELDEQLSNWSRVREEVGCSNYPHQACNDVSRTIEI
ncbi:hypothetical protein J6590_026665 [Homalodisca vitripennis]|nr:hypothetical protein J6590_026665 [Homalodisca vitripennis]